MGMNQCQSSICDDTSDTNEGIKDCLQQQRYQHNIYCKDKDKNKVKFWTRYDNTSDKITSSQHVFPMLSDTEANAASLTTISFELDELMN